MDAEKFLDLYEQAVNKSMEQQAKTLGEIGAHIAELACIARMRVALAGADIFQGDA